MDFITSKIRNFVQRKLITKSRMEKTFITSKTEKGLIAKVFSELS
jgi:hypothetical protein